MNRVGCLLLIALFSGPAMPHDHDIRLAVSRITGVTDGADAPYNRLLSVVVEQTRFNMLKEYYPTARSNFLLEHQQVDCIFPIAQGAHRRHIEVIYSQSVNRVTTHLFSYGTDEFRHLSDVANEVVVYIRGYLFGDLVNTQPHNVSFIPVDTHHSALQLLKTGRAKAYLEYLPDIRFALSKEQLEQLRYSREFPVQETFDIFECYASQKNATFILNLNQVLTHLKTSGRLQELLGDYYNLN